MRVFCASHLFPVSTPPLRDAAVAVEDDRIVAVGPREEVLRRAGETADRVDLGTAAVLPGLVNVHCHVELSWLGEDPPPGGDYAAWIDGLIERRAAEDPTTAVRAAARAIAAMVGRGTVALGDVANATWVVPLLARSSLRGVVFHEVYDPRPDRAERTLTKAIERLEEMARDPDRLAAGERWRIVLTPHAPHTTSEALLRALARRATAAGEPFSVHTAESAAETTLLMNGSGPLRALLERRGMWDEGSRPPGVTPVGLLDRVGALGPRTLAVHCVHLNRQDRSKLQARGACVVTCPRSNERLGVGTAPVPQLLAEGIPVGLGTDSLASTVDLDLFAEMAALRRLHPRLTPAAVLRIATLNGATALGLADDLGSVEPGKLARLIVVPLEPDDDDPLATLCSVPREVFPLEQAPPRLPEA